MKVNDILYMISDGIVQKVKVKRITTHNRAADNPLITIGYKDETVRLFSSR